MRKNMLLVLVAILLLPLISCDDDDGYSLGKYWITTATIETGSVNPYVIVTDDGDRLFPSSTAIPWYQVRDKQRIWINYTILGDAVDGFNYYVKVNDMSEILTKGFLELTPEIADSIGDDPVTIKNYWITDDFLTVEFYYGGGEAIHYINLVQDVDNPVNDDGLPVLLFRHNRKDDPANYKIKGTVSFNLYDLRVEGEKYVHFVFKATTFDGEDPFEVALTYNYGE